MISCWYSYFLLVLTKPLKPHIPFLMRIFVCILSQWDFSSYPENLDGYMDLNTEICWFFHSLINSLNSLRPCFWSLLFSALGSGTCLCLNCRALHKKPLWLRMRAAEVLDQIWFQLLCFNVLVKVRMSKFLSTIPDWSFR